MENSEKIGIVIPTYNRLENLQLVLASLEQQTDTGYHVIIADDGSTDDTQQYLSSLSKTSQWSGKLDWVYCGENEMGRRGRTRNIGVSKLPQGIENLIFLDSDAILIPNAIENFRTLFSAYEHHIVFGVTEWLPELDKEFILSQIQSKNAAELIAKVPRQTPTLVQGTYVGPEIRDPKLYKKLSSHKVDGRWSLFSNTGMRVGDFLALGGFNEEMDGYGYEDMEFGIRCEKFGLNCVYSKELVSFHRWHPKSDSTITHLENQKNLHYVLKTYGSNPYFEKSVDWTLWWHYSSSRGAFIVKDEDTLWAVNNRRKFKLMLSDHEWLRRLGFSEKDVKRKPLFYKRISDMGTAYLTPIDERIYGQMYV